jgi:TolB-like protein/Flp pilus assembly protein TadD
VPEVERLMSRMLAKDPAARPRDLREIVVDLRRLRAGVSPLLPTGELTVAVAGFVGISDRAEDAWLGTGLSETVTTTLQEIEGLVVLGREQLRESLRRLGVEATELAPEDAAQLGRMIGARWVLSGAFQRLGEQVRVTGRVVEVESGRVVRAVKMDGRLDAIFQLQDRIVADLAAGLRGSVAAAHEGEETKVVAAYEAFSKGLLNVRADSYEALDRAILYFERAVALDPEYVRAQIELAAAYEQKGNYLTAPELHERSVAILRKALETRPRLPRVWRELGMSLISLDRVADGIEHLRRAQSLAPDDARVLAGLARGLFIGMGDFRAAADLFERSVERNPEAGWYWMQLAHCCAFLRDFKRGEKAAKRAIELQEGFLSGQQGVLTVGSYMRLGHLFALQNRAREAHDAVASEIVFLEKIDHALRSRIRIELYMRLGQSLLALGESARAGDAFEISIEAFAERLALGADEPFTRYYAAAVHALRGENDEAIDLLEKAAAGKRAFVVARARIEPEWDGLRGGDRFKRLIA